MSNEAAAREHDPTLPRTDGERHLPDGKVPSSKELKRTESPDEETLRMMEEVGFDSSMPIDPSSLKALQELLTPKRSHGKSLAKLEDSKEPAMPNLTAERKEETTKEQASLNTSVLSAHVPSEVLRPIALGRVTSELTMGLRSESMAEEETDASTAGSTQRATTMDKRILDQLQMQTQLLLDLQRRVDELSQIVIAQQGQLHQQAGFPPAQGHFEHMRNVHQAADQTIGGNVPPVQQQHQPRNVPQPAAQEPPQMFILALFTFIPNYIRSTRVAEICRVYWALHRRDMGGRIDMNLIIKILFMGAILMAKFSASHKRKKGAERTMKSSVQMYVAIFLIVGGFLLQSGYLRFLHNFFIKERYVQRIWNGEEIDVAAQQPPRRAERREENEAQEEAENEGPGLLRGGIAQAPAQAGMIGKFVMDIVYLFGSFLLSILPMWKAQAQQQPGRRRVDANQRPQIGQQNEGEEQDGNGGGA